tara:strand:+ start:319 stop:654 length:336 start_codon:yes stop_codon:yes gene_type:complete
MIVVAIIGILAAIAIPNYMQYQCKARQSEAKSNLGNIRAMQEAYLAETDRYANTMSVLGFNALGNSRYNYSIRSANATLFTASASGMINNNQDVWTITQGGTLVNDTNACD